MSPRARLDRIRALLPGHAIREIPMFGTVALMVDDAMLIAVAKDGRMLVRVDPAEDADLLGEPDAQRARMGRQRDMGPGWLMVDADPTDDRLGYWVDAALRRTAPKPS